MNRWRRDFLPGYEAINLPLPDVVPAAGEPIDTELVATLIRRSPGDQSHTTVLYLHGWNDYFFQTHLADRMIEFGYDFYALCADAAVACARDSCAATSPTSTTTAWNWARQPT